MKIRYTKYISISPISKEFSYNKSLKKAEKRSLGEMYDATAEVIDSDLKSFGASLAAMGSHEACSFGIPLPKFKNPIIQVTTNKRRSQFPNAMVRDNKDMTFRKGVGGIFFIDYDPSPYGGKPLSPKQFLKILFEVDPQLASCEYVLRGSVSAGVHIKGGKVKAGDSFHLYFSINDMAAIPAYGKLLYDKLWLAGHGFMALSKVGGMMERTLVDACVWQSNRLDFTGQPVVVSPELIYSAPEMTYVEGVSIDPKLLPKLTAKELNDLLDKKHEARVKRQPEVPAMKAAYVKNNTASLMARGFNLDEAIAILKDRTERTVYELYAYDLLQFKNPELGDVMVQNVLAEPHRFEGEALVDPDEDRGSYPDDSARFYWNKGENPLVVSWGHGGRNFKLHKAGNDNGGNTDNVNDDVDGVGYVGEEDEPVVGFGGGGQSESNRNAGNNGGNGTGNNSAGGGGGGNNAGNNNAGGGGGNSGDWQRPIDRNLFPHWSAAPAKIKATRENFDFFLEYYGINVVYDEILKHQKITFPEGYNFENNVSESGKVADIQGLLTLCNMQRESLNLLPSVFMRNTINPVKDMILSKPWDGKSRLKKLFDTVNVKSSDIEYRDKLMRVWLIQAVAAADKAQLSPIPYKIAKYELTLGFQGYQGAKKTSWLSSLVPENMKAYVVDSVQMDLKDKDSRLEALSSWLTELGEYDGVMKKNDEAQTKSFASRQFDSIRLPYGRVADRLARQTVFFASFNDPQVLGDRTGNRRLGALAVLSTNAYHKIDMQQLWAEVWQLYIKGEQWWPDDDLAELCKEQSQKFMKICHVEEAIKMVYDLDIKPKRTKDSELLNVKNILFAAGLTYGTSELRICTRLLALKGFEKFDTKHKKNCYVLELIDNGNGGLHNKKS